MDLDVRGKMPSKFRKPLQNNPQNIAAKQIEIEASSLPNLFKKSLKGLARELKADGCNPRTQYDCTMHVSLKATDRKKLIVDFLAQVLALTYAHQTIFSSMYIQELSEKKLEVQLYGNWFGSLDNRANRIVENASTLERKSDGSYKASLLVLI